MSNLQSQAPWHLPILTIDLRKRRLRLYKHILRLLGDPDYVQFLVNPEKRIFAVRQGNEKETDSQKIYWTILKDNRQCCEFYSKNLVEKLQILFSDRDDERTYRIVGKYNKLRNSVVFDLHDSEPITNEPEAIDSSCNMNQNTKVQCTN